MISAVAALTQVELHLLGDLREDDRLYFDSLITLNHLAPASVQFHLPIPSTEIIPFAAQFDIGLATETGFPYNRDICLTNKIFTYIQAGIGIIASDTQAQKWLIDQYPAIGYIYEKGNSENLIQLLKALQVNPILLENQKKAAAVLGENTLNWEQESHSFLGIVNSLIR